MDNVHEVYWLKISKYTSASTSNTNLCTTNYYSDSLLFKVLIIFKAILS